MPHPDARLIWIVGASSGIGRALAEHFARAGDKVVVSARRAAELHQLEAEFPGRITAMPLDATDHEALRGAADEIEARSGAIDILIYSAGLWHPMGLETLDRGRFEASFRVNLFGAVSAVMAVLVPMRRRGKGRIVLISSVAAWRGLPGAAAYGASKAALTCFAEALRPECAAAGIVLQVVAPGFVDTPMTSVNRFPMPFIIDAAEAATRIADGLRGERFELHFPKALSRPLKLLSCLPYGLFFRLTRRLIRTQKQT